MSAAPTSFTPEEIQWAARVAARLRFIQADLADLSTEERQAHFDDEIARAVRDLVPERRKRHLAALAEQFPTFAIAQQAEPRSEPVDNSPEALVEALIRIAPQLPKQKLTEFGVLLQQAGYMGLKTATLVSEPPPEFLKMFPIEDGQPVDLQRLYRFALIFADFFLRLDVFAWSIWQQVAQHSRIRRDGGAHNDPRRLGARYLSGDDEVSAEQIKQIVEKTRQVVAGLLGAVGGGGRAFASRFAAEFSPENILTLAKADHGLKVPLFASDDVRGWQKFKQLFSSQSDEVIEEKLHQAIANAAENLMRGTRTESYTPNS